MSEPKMNKRKINIIKPVLAIVGLAVLYFAVTWVAETFRNPNQMGILESMSMDMEVQVPQGAMPVEMETVQLQPFSAMVTYTGTADAYNDVPVYPRIDGWVRSAPVYSGDRVKRGQVLAKLDTDEYSARYHSARSNRKKSHDAIQAAKANLTYWESEIKRAEALVQDEVITQEEYDREKSQYESAQSQYEQALSGYDSAAAMERTQRIVLDYTTVVAPVSGVVTDRKLDEGVFVKPGMELMRIAQIDPIRIQVNVAESDAEKINVNAPVWIWQGRHQTGQPVEAKVTSVFPEKDLSTRTAVVEAVVPNSDQRFVPGDFITMAIEISEKKDALTVSNQALIYKDQQQGVWVAQDGKARFQYVVTGGSNGTRTEITHGLKTGDVVVTQGHQSLTYGSTIVAAEYGPEGLKKLPEAVSSNRMSPENNYQVKQNLSHALMVATLQNPPAKTGDNTIEIQLSPMHGDLPKNMSVEAKTFMPAMPKMMVPKPSVQSKGNGLFHVKTQLTMPGLWQIDIIVKEGGKPLGEGASIQVEVIE